MDMLNTNYQYSNENKYQIQILIKIIQINKEYETRNYMGPITAKDEKLKNVGI